MRYSRINANTARPRPKAAGLPRVNADGSIRVSAFLLPRSSFLREETRIALENAQERQTEWTDAYKACPPPMEGTDRAKMSAIRKCQAEAIYKTSAYVKVRDRYDVAVGSEKIGGVFTEIFTPSTGVARDNEKRVLINLHGGGFLGGSCSISHLESIPIAFVGKIRVISIDYRMAPEYTFPAATEDVAAVYRQLLKTYEPKDIGIYGCSAGAVLTAQAIALLQSRGLPLPGAVGMFCGAANYWAEGDSGIFGAALTGISAGTSREHPYFKNADPDDPLVFPVRSGEMIAKFPPSLLIASTRDCALSSVVHTHSRLVAQGVEANLHVWEGLDHAFIYDPNLCDSREAYEVIVQFFSNHLGEREQGRIRPAS